MSGTIDQFHAHAEPSSEGQPTSSQQAVLRRNERLLGRSRRARFLARVLGRDDAHPTPTIQRLERIDDEPATAQRPGPALDAAPQTVVQPRSDPHTGSRREPRPVPAAVERRRD